MSARLGAKVCAAIIFLLVACSCPAARAAEPFDIVVEKVAISWLAKMVIVNVRVQGTNPDPASKARLLTCFLEYSNFPPEALRPPRDGAYVFVEPEKQRQDVVSYKNTSGLHVVRIPFVTLANEVLARCKAWPDQAESDQTNNDGHAFSQRPPKPGEKPRYLLEMTATPVKDPGDHLRLTVRFTNPTSVLLSNLRLILVKNHVAIKEWKPIGLHPGTLGQVHYQDSMPAPFASSRYEAILTTDLTSALPAPASILDRRATFYRRAGTVRGGP